ncbi:histidinol dehydrogenase [Kribbella sp. NPDC058245]|uniref:histidinol dehydrogenase n=1 Tax=Kribbella sp. NPDC058245 TaxID=3346399 RepID=UPI0036E59F77
MAEHLKTGWPQKVERQQEVIDTVSRILREVEREGEPAIRRWSARLDGWEPPAFVVPAERIKAAAETVDDELAEHAPRATPADSGSASSSRPSPTSA